MMKVPQEPLWRIMAAAVRAHKQSCSGVVVTQGSVTHMLNLHLCLFFPVSESALRTVAGI